MQKLNPLNESYTEIICREIQTFDTNGKLFFGLLAFGQLVINDSQVVGGCTLLSLLTFALIQYFYWININKVKTRQLQRQISWVATFLIFGIGIPFTIIKRSQKMTEYGKEFLKGKVQDTFPCLNFTDDIIESESQDGTVCFINL